MKINYIMNYKPILKKALSSIDSPNLILYGYHAINKNEILNEILNEYLDTNTINETSKYDINYCSNSILKIFDMDKIKRSKIEDFFTLLSESIKCKNYYIENNRILIIQNFNHIDRNIQDRLRVTFEKYRINTLFILTTDYYNSILNPIKSRFLSLRIRDLSRNDKISNSYPIIKNLTYDKRIKVYDHIYKFSNKDTILNFSKNNHGLINNHKDIIKNIYHSLKNMKVLELSTIKDYAYNLEKYHIKNFHSDFLKLIIDEFHKIKLKECIFKITEIEYLYQKSFNRILSNEFLLILIYETHKGIYLEERK